MTSILEWCVGYRNARAWSRQPNHLSQFDKLKRAALEKHKEWLALQDIPPWSVKTQRRCHRLVQ